MKTQECNTHSCNLVDGGWSDFGSWTECSATCGGGIKTRIRTCTNPAPENGGADCVGDSVKTQECNTHSCNLVDGGWSDFGSWTECSATCGGGIKTRIRTCTNPAPENGGADCVGDSVKTQECNTHSCNLVDGGWSDFGSWTECSATCGGGIRTRIRTCTNSAPEYGGADCQGSNIETQPCNIDPCIPVDGGWSDFGSWTECSATCGGGVKTRSRTCTNPAPENGGADCVGDSVKTEECNSESCFGKLLLFGSAVLYTSTTNSTPPIAEST